MRRSVTSTFLVAGLVAVAGLALPATAAVDPGQVALVNGVDGTVLDVFQDATILVDDLATASEVGDFALPAGSVLLRVTDTDAAGAADYVVEAVDVPSGVPSTVVVGLDGDGTAAGVPDLSLFVDDTSLVPSGQARIVLRNAANIDSATLRVTFEDVGTLADLAHGEQGSGFIDTGASVVIQVLDTDDAAVIDPFVFDPRSGYEHTFVLTGSDHADDADRPFTLRQFSTSLNGERLYGDDRYETGAALVASGFPIVPAGGVSLVYLASGGNFPDALAFGNLPAGGRGAPVLLVPADLRSRDDGGLPPSIAAQLDRLRPARIVVLGGPAAVSDEVLAAARTAAGLG